MRGVCVGVRMYGEKREEKKKETGGCFATVSFE
jgi:hypothetical protein